METNKRHLIEAIAADLGIKKPALLKWRERGVPYRWHIPILRHAAERGLDISQHDLRPVEAAAVAPTISPHGVTEPGRRL